MKRERVCVVCGSDFSYNIGRGKDRIVCSKECGKIKALKKIKENRDRCVYSTCSVEGCRKPANRVGAGLCEACYMRQRRKGTTDHTVYPTRTIQSGGYIRIKNKSHPLADSQGTVYEHRLVYHNHFGEGPFLCNWCGKTVTWFDMHVDHLDDNVTNNDISNLVASCPLCNQSRGRHKMVATRRSKGKLLTYNGVTACVSEWASKLGISAASLQSRLSSGWSIEKALTQPKGKTGPKGRKYANKPFYGKTDRECHAVKSAAEGLARR